MKPHEKILLELKMLDVGIVPNTDYRANVESQLKLMSPDEARRAKRKWRKLKRKAMARSSIRNPKSFHEKFAVLMMLTREDNT